MDFLQNIRTDAEKLAEEMGLSIYDVEWIASEKTLRISLDIEGKLIDVDTCGQFSDRFSSVLDEKDLIEGNYFLEVCSPGAERNLRTHEEMENAIGSYVYCKLKDPKAGMDEVQGDLLEVNDDFITISYRDKTKTKTVSIDTDNIRLIRLAIKF